MVKVIIVSKSSLRALNLHCAAKEVDKLSRNQNGTVGFFGVEAGAVSGVMS